MPGIAQDDDGTESTASRSQYDKVPVLYESLPADTATLEKPKPPIYDAIDSPFFATERRNPHQRIPDNLRRRSSSPERAGDAPSTQSPSPQAPTRAWRRAQRKVELAGQQIETQQAKLFVRMQRMIRIDSALGDTTREANFEARRQQTKARVGETLRNAGRSERAVQRALQKIDRRYDKELSADRKLLNDMRRNRDRVVKEQSQLAENISRLTQYKQKLRTWNEGGRKGRSPTRVRPLRMK